MPFTIKDVVEMADVSILTVSRAINDSKPVGPEARRRVSHAIEVLDYKSDGAARSLVTKKSNLIGVIANDIDNGYVSQVLRGVEEIGRMFNYDVLLSSSYGDLEVEMRFTNLSSQKQVEGITLISDILNEHLMFKLDKLKIPYVIINRFYTIDETATVSINNKNAIHKMTRNLVEAGHEKIGYVALRRDMDRTNETYKVKGYKEAIRQCSLKLRVVYSEGLDREDALEAMEDILDDIKDHKYTALFCTQNILVIHLMNALFDQGIKTPDDIGICGSGGTVLSEVVRPALTTVKEPFYDIGVMAIRKLLKSMESREELTRDIIFLPVEALKRESVKSL